MSAAAAFDKLATRYDQLWTESAAGRAQRELVWRQVDPLFPAGARMLDLGCGTGVDAAHYAARSVVVDAVDASPAMIERARARGGFTARVLAMEQLASLEGVYDGVLSNFGVLNCGPVGDLPHALARLVRPGGTLALCTIGRFCAWETLYYSARGRFRTAFRRIPGSASSSLGITVRYPTVRELAATFAPPFRLLRWMGIGLAAPPSYVALTQRVVQTLGALDRGLARLPLLRAAADHRLLIFVRK